MQKSKSLIQITCAILTLFCCSCGNSKPDSNQKAAEQKEQIAISVSATDFYNDIMRKNAANKYLRKPVLLAGKIKIILPSNFLGLPEIKLAVGENGTEFEVVECRFSKDDLFKVMNLLPGQEVKIQGISAGVTAASLDKSVLVDFGSSPPKEYSLNDLRKLLGADPEKNVNELAKTNIIFSDRIGKIAASQNPRRIEFIFDSLKEGSNSVSLVASVATYEDVPLLAGYLKELKPGSMMRLSGRLELYKNNLILNNATPMPISK